MMQWAPDNWTMTATDDACSGRVKFHTRMEVTEGTSGGIPASAMFTIACYYMLSRMNEKSLAEACQNLFEIYSWQDRGTPQVVSAAPRKMKLNKPLKPSREPHFSLED